VDHDEVSELLGAAALDALLDDRQRLDIEQHVSWCDACARELSGARRTAALLTLLEPERAGSRC
jgi:hypothetical protein